MPDMDIVPEALTIESFCACYGVGRTYTYELFKAGALRPVKAGRRTLIPAEQARAWFKSLHRACDKGGGA